MRLTFVEKDWREVSPYLDALLELNGDAREKWLQALDGIAPAVVTRLRKQVQQLELLESSAFLDSVPVVMPEASLDGQRFGAYTLDRVLGHGGMGSVWLAHRSDGRFEGQAAVKLLSPRLVGHPSERLFAREGSLLARLRHPNISRLLDAGVAGGNQPYLVLEYVPGQHIDRYCQKHDLDLHTRIRLFLNVLDAVAHAHSNLIVHRDIKPSNILVTDDGVVKLLDFGVGALLSPTPEGTAPPTLHAAPGLTPGYAAPEQLRGEALTTATDVYALGLVLCVLLAGHHPFASDHGTPAQLMQATLEREVPRPSDIADSPGLARMLRGDLDNIITMALRRDPAERYATADQFAQDLRRYLALEPISARPRSMMYRATLFVRRHRGMMVLTASLAMVLIAGVVATTVQMLEAERQRAEAARRRDQARFETRRAETSSDFLEFLMVTNPSPERVQTFYDRLELGVQLLDRQHRDDPQFAGRMLVQFATDYRDNEETRRANELYAKAYELGRRTHDVELMVSAQCNRAYGDAWADVPEGLAQRIGEARRLLAQLRDPSATLRAECLEAEARMEQRRGSDRLAENLLLEAQRILEADGSTYRILYTSILTELGDIYLSRNQPSKALQITRLVGEMHDRNGRGGTSARTITYQNEATLLQALGEIRAALAQRQIVKQRLADLESPGQTAFAYSVNYAKVVLRMDRPQEALRALDEETARVRGAGNPLVLANWLEARGAALIDLQRWDEAEKTLIEAQSLVSGGFGNKSLGAEIESWQAQLEVARGNLGAARHHVDRSLVLAGYHGPKPERSLLRVLLVAARVALIQGAASTGEEFARDALRIAESIARGRDTSADVGEALLRLGQARLALRATADTHALLERAIRCLTNGLTPDHPLTIEARALDLAPT